MNEFNRLKPLAKGVYRYFWAFVAAWTLIVVMLLLQDIHEIRDKIIEMAKREALVHLNKDLAARLWAASHGGVYVPVTGKTPPNPFLNHIPDRDIKTPGGKSLTLMNPAYMLRQMMDESADLYGVRGHITGLKSFRKETAPDDWERTALTSFESGASEASEFVAVEGVPFFRLMRPLMTEESCLNCHGHQGYKPGDVRGGVSVSLPIMPYLAAQRKEIVAHSASFAILWLLGIIFIGFSVRGLRIYLREREKAENLLTVSEENYSSVIENSLTGICIIQDGVIKFANTRAAEIYGYSKEEITGIDSLALVPPEDRDFIKDIREKRLQREDAPSEYEARGLRKDGETIWIQRRNTLVEFDGEPAILGNVLDVTDLRRATDDANAYADELKRSNRELEQFAAMASHDLSEPLRKVRMFGDILKEKYHFQLDHQGKDYVERMQKAATRMQNMIDALLSLSRVTTRVQPFTNVHLADSVKEALSNLEILIQKTSGRVRVDDLPRIEGDPSQMIHLFQNLIGNGLKFHRTGEPPVVHVRAEMIPSQNYFQEGDRSPSYGIYVEDNGIGFDEEHLSRIFLPFERLHGREEYEGTGMGLAICQKIVERHGGTITAKSVVGKGSTFIITLPARQMPGKDNSEAHSSRQTKTEYAVHLTGQTQGLGASGR